MTKPSRAKIRSKKVSNTKHACTLLYSLCMTPCSVILSLLQNELERSINEASDWCDNNAMILHPAKTKRMLLTTRQKYQLRPLHLNLSLKDILNKFMSTDTLALLLMMNLAGDHTLLAFVKQFQKIFICCHSSDTLWTLLSANCFTMLIFPLT